MTIREVFPEETKSSGNRLMTPEDIHSKFIQDFYSESDPAKQERIVRADMAKLTGNDVCRDLDMLAGTLSAQGKHSAAADVYKELTNADKRIYGKDFYHHDCFESEASKAGAEMMQAKRYKDAEDLYSTELNIKETIAQDNKAQPGLRNPYACLDNIAGVASSMLHVGDALMGQNKFAAAQQIYAKSLARMRSEKTCFGNDPEDAKKGLIMSELRQGHFLDAIRSMQIDTAKILNDTQVTERIVRNEYRSWQSLTQSQLEYMESQKWPDYAWTIKKDREWEIKYGPALRQAY